MLAFLAGPLGKYVIYAAIALGAVLVLLGLKHGYDEGKRDEGRAEVRTEEVAPLQKRLDEAQARGAAIATLWDEQRQKTEREEALRAKAEAELAKARAAEVGRLSPAPTLRLSDDLVRLWGNLSRAADDPQGGSAKGDAGKPEAGATTISERALGGFLDDAKAAYDDALGLFHACRSTLAGYLEAHDPASAL